LFSVILIYYKIESKNIKIFRIKWFSFGLDVESYVLTQFEKYNLDNLVVLPV